MGVETSGQQLELGTAETAAPQGRVWSPCQQAIFEDFADGVGHTVIEAVAGSGKSTTLIKGLDYVPRGLTTVMLAFNASTAQALKERVPPGVHAMTSHGLGYRAILWAWGKMFPGGIKVDEDKEYELSKQLFPTWSDDDRSALLKATSLAKAWAVTSPKHLAGLVREYDCSTTGATPEELVDGIGALLVASTVPSATISFDDMVFLPVVLGLKPRPFDRVLIDETQDLSRAQVELALMACRKGGRITAVGDRRQALYGFRGADSRSIPNLIKRLNAKVLPLSVTYRCARAVVAHVREIVPQIEAKPGAPEGVVRADVPATTMYRDWRAGDFVLSRTNAPLVRLCLRALRAGIPAFVLGRDVGAGLRALVARYKGATTTGLVAFVRAWRDGEHARLRAVFGKPADDPRAAPLKKSEADKLDAVDDRFETIVALAEDVATTGELLAKLGRLFDEVGKAPRLMFSSTHKAKGLEAPRVWLLERTYRRGTDPEEDNLYYVAATRAERELNLVGYDPKRAADR